MFTSGYSAGREMQLAGAHPRAIGPILGISSIDN